MDLLLFFLGGCGGRGDPEPGRGWRRGWKREGGWGPRGRRGRRGRWPRRDRRGWPWRVATGEPGPGSLSAHGALRGPGGHRRWGEHRRSPDPGGKTRTPPPQIRHPRPGRAQGSHPTGQESQLEPSRLAIAPCHLWTIDPGGTDMHSGMSRGGKEGEGMKFIVLGGGAPGLGCGLRSPEAGRCIGAYTMGDRGHGCSGPFPPRSTGPRGKLKQVEVDADDDSSLYRYMEGMDADTVRPSPTTYIPEGEPGGHPPAGRTPCDLGVRTQRLWRSSLNWTPRRGRPGHGDSRTAAWPRGG